MTTQSRGADPGKQALSHVAGGKAKCHKYSQGKLAAIYQSDRCIDSLTQNPLLGTHSRGISLHIPHDVYLRLLISEMLVIAKDWKQPNYALAGSGFNLPQCRHPKRGSYAMTSTGLQEELIAKKQSAEQYPRYAIISVRKEIRNIKLYLFTFA